MYIPQNCQEIRNTHRLNGMRFRTADDREGAEIRAAITGQMAEALAEAGIANGSRTEASATLVRAGFTARTIEPLIDAAMARARIVTR